MPGAPSFSLLLLLALPPCPCSPLPPSFRPPLRGRGCGRDNVPERGTSLSFVCLRVCGTFVRVIGTVTQSLMTRKRGVPREDQGTSGWSEPLCGGFPARVPEIRSLPSCQYSVSCGEAGRGLREKWAGRASICGSSWG